MRSGLALAEVLSYSASMLRFLCLGDWAESSVSSSWVAGTRRIEPAVEAAIEAAWGAASAKLGNRLFDGPMCRLEQWQADADRLHLKLSRTSYKPFLGTNMAHPEFASRFGPQVMANPVGVSAILQTADGLLLLGRRNESVAYYPGRIHTFAGCLEPGDGGEDQANVFATARRELGEELSLSPADVAQMRCLGIVEDQKLLQCEVIFFVRLAMARAAVEARLDAEEHRSAFAVAGAVDAVEPIVRQRGEVAGEPALTPVAVGSLLLWGRHQIGAEWFERNVAGVGRIG